MELHDHPFSPYAFKVRAALYEKGIPFEKREVQKHADRERLLRLNPRGEVPAIVDGEAVICDSNVICAYLEERFPEPPLLPKDPVQRARARALELKSDGDLDACVFVLGLLKLTRPEVAKQVPGALENAVQALASHCAQLEREVKGREWFVGDFSLVDILQAGCSKGTALADWARERGYTRDEVMAVGDNLNDLEMLEFAGCPVVMGNGIPDLRDRGWSLTATNDEAGVARAVETFIIRGAS